MPIEPKPSNSPLAHAAYWSLKSVVAAALSMPRGGLLSTAGAMGARFGGGRANTRRLRRAKANIAAAFPEWSDERVHATAVACYDHLFRLGVEVGLGPQLLTADGWVDRVHVGDVSGPVRTMLAGRPVLLITAHVGNWEVIGQTIAMLGFPMHALYRRLDLAPLDEWVRRSRSRRGLELIDKFGAVQQLPQLVRSGAPLGFVADQNGGDRGLFVPFFGRLTSTYKAIALTAMQFNADVLCGMARRVTDPAELRAKFGPRASEDPREVSACRYAFEADDAFGPADWRTHPDPAFYIAARFRRAIEAMVRRAPEQYLWMHRIWRSRPLHERQAKPFPPALLDKLRALPWMDEEQISRLVERSRRDALLLARTGRSRFDEPPDESLADAPAERAPQAQAQAQA